MSEFAFNNFWDRLGRRERGSGRGGGFGGDLGGLVPERVSRVQSHLNCWVALQSSHHFNTLASFFHGVQRAIEVDPSLPALPRNAPGSPVLSGSDLDRISRDFWMAFGDAYEGLNDDERAAVRAAIGDGQEPRGLDGNGEQLRLFGDGDEARGG